MAKPFSKFRNPSNQRLMKQLFFENCYGQEEKLAVYTLKDYDHEGYPSLYRLYMDKADTTEFEFAEEYLDGYEHWEMLCRSRWFASTVARWRKELLLKLQAQALNRIKIVAETPEHKSAYEASKFLLAASWLKSGASRGRPSKEEVKAEAERIAKAEQETQEDAERILN